MQFEKLNYIPEDLTKEKMKKWEPIVTDFVNDDESKTIVFKLNDEADYKKCYSAVSRLARLKYHNLTVFSKSKLFQIYLIKSGVQK